MQVHELKLNSKKPTRKRVGRGGQHGTYSGKGQKGQKARAGATIRPDFRGGNQPIWKLFPKRRGASKKTKIKHAFFAVKRSKPIVLNLDFINSIFKEAEKVSPDSLAEKGIIKDGKTRVKILGGGRLEKKLQFEGIIVSKSAQKAILSKGGKVII